MRADVVTSRAAGAAAPVRHAHFPEIDGLRAVAVLSVMLFHLRENLLPGGFLGVDIFFVISGFVVTQSIKDASFPSFGAFLTYFYARRIFRILPMLAVTIVVTSVFFVLFVPEAWLSRDIDRTGLAAIFGFSNMVLARGNDYFSPSAAYNPFTHTWSLGVEEQFYFVFPFIMYFGLRWRSRLVLALLAVSFAVSLHWSASAPLKAFYWLPSRFWELGAGMLACLTLPSWLPFLEKRPFPARLLAWASLGLLVAGFAVQPAWGVPTPWALLAVAGTLGLVAAMLARPDLGTARILRAPLMVGIGRISYSLYLWHWPVYVIMRWTIGYDQPLHAALAVALTFALSVLSFRWIETPARNWQRRNPVGLRPIAAGAVAAMLVLATSATLFHYKADLTLSVTGDLPVWYPDTAWLDLPEGPCAVAETEENLSGVDISVFTPNGCAAPQTAGTLFVAGDSHVDAYQRMLKRYAFESGRMVRSYALPGCGVVNFRAADSGGRCTRLEDVVIADIVSRAAPGDVVFLPSLRVWRWADQWGTVAASADQRRAKEQAAASGERMESLTRRIAETGAQIVFEGPTPLFKLAPFRCSDWFNRSNPVCEAGFAVAAAELEERRSPSLEGIRELTRRVANVSLWDAFPLLCSETVCDAMRDGRPLFFDQDHLSGYGNDVLLPSFAAAMSDAFSKVSIPATARQSSR